MAVTTTNTQNHAPEQNAQATQGAGVFTQNQTQQAAAQIADGGQFSWLGGMNSLLSIGRHPISETVKALEECFTKFAQDSKLPIDFRTLVIDNNNYTELQYSVVVLAGVPRGLTEKKLVFYHAYLIEQSGKPLTNETRNINGLQVELQRLASDANDKTLRDLVQKTVLQNFVGYGAVETSAEVVPTSFDLKSEAALFNLFVNGLLALRAAIDHLLNPNDLQLSKAAKDSTLSVVAERNNSIVTDTAGLPARADMVLSTIARSLQQGQVGSLNTQRTQLVSRMTGFIDFMWDRKAQPMAYYAQSQQPKFEPLYQPVFVITNGTPELLQSVPSQLQMLASAAVLAEQNRWTFGLMPRKGLGKKKAHDLHDIGAVGIDANFQNNPDGYGARIEGTDKDDFTMGKLNELLSMVANPGLLLAMDVPECGASTWQHSIFSAAAEGDATAVDDIVKAADYLTSGNFSKCWKGGRIAYNWGGRIHLGYYYDQERNMRDIRDISYLAVLNLFGERDMNVVRQWSDSFNAESIPLDIRLSQRKAVLDTLSPVYTGFGRRVVFDGNFIMALAQACAMAGLSLKPELPYQDMSSDVRMTAPFVGTAAVMGAAATGLFNNVGTAYTGASNFYNGMNNGFVHYGPAVAGQTTL